MYDDDVRDWWAGDGDYQWAARQRTTSQPAAPPDEAPGQPSTREDLNRELLGDLYETGYEPLALPTRVLDSRPCEDQRTPPGMGGA